MRIQQVWFKLVDQACMVQTVNLAVMPDSKSFFLFFLPVSTEVEPNCRMSFCAHCIHSYTGNFVWKIFVIFDLELGPSKSIKKKTIAVLYKSTFYCAIFVVTLLNSKFCPLLIQPRHHWVFTTCRAQKENITQWAHKWKREAPGNKYLQLFWIQVVGFFMFSHLSNCEPLFGPLGPIH